MRKLRKIKLHWQILAALALAVAASTAVHVAAGISGMSPSETATGLVQSCQFVGRMFFNALKMIVVPLIMTSIICGMMGLGDDKNFSRLGLKTLGYYLLTGLLAILTGLVMVNLIQPGQVDPATAEAIMNQAQDPSVFMEKVEGRSGGDFLEIFIRMIPPNIFAAASDNGQLLGIIVFSLLFGYFIAHLPPALRTFQENLWNSLLGIMTGITDLVIRFTPIGVFALITPVLIETGLSTIRPVFLFFITVLGSLLIHFLVTLPLLLRLFKVDPARHYRATAPALLTAFSTASSASTLPVTLECMEKNAGVSNRVASFTLPLGATVNMDGTALYECVVVIFIAQFQAVATGVSIDLTTQLTVVLLALLTSVGVAGIPSASLVAIVVILGAVGLQVEYVGIVMVVDRILDMCRTSVNVFSDTCGAAIVARTEGEIFNPPES